MAEEDLPAIKLLAEAVECPTAGWKSWLKKWLDSCATKELVNTSEMSLLLCDAYIISSNILILLSTGSPVLQQRLRKLAYYYKTAAAIVRLAAELVRSYVFRSR